MRLSRNVNKWRAYTKILGQNLSQIRFTVYRAPRFTGPKHLPPRGPVNRGFTVFQYKVDSRSMSFGLRFIGRTQPTFSSFTVGVDDTFTSDLLIDR